MEKKFKFSDNPSVAKALYGGIIALLCVSAIIVGIVAANNRKKDVAPTPDNPPVSDGTDDNNGDNGNNGDEGGTQDKEESATFISPVAGSVLKNHSATVPVYSETLEEWRIHTGIDISCEEGADVFAASSGEVTRVYSDPLLGKSVEITHEGGIKTVYSNLSPDGLIIVGSRVLVGEKIGTVGDSAVSEIADEAHLHFEVLLNDASVNPLDYITEESKKTSLGITDEEAA